MPLQTDPAGAAAPPARKRITFLDVVRFAAGYWRRQPGRLGVVLAMLVTTAILETYLPTALSNFLGAIQQDQGRAAILACLTVFLGVYLVQSCLASITFFLYNSFETILFKHVMDDAFLHVYRLPEHFFVNTFTGSIITKITRGRRMIETFEDQLLLKIFPAFIVMIGSIVFLGLKFPLIAALMTAYLGVLVVVSCLMVFRVSGPAQGLYAEAQDAFGAHLADSIGGMATTKAYAQEHHETARFVDITRGLRRFNILAYHRSQWASLTQRILLAGMLALLLIGGTRDYLAGRATVANMAYLAFAYNIMQSYIRDIGENIKSLLTSSYDLHAVIALMREEPEVAALPVLPALDIRQGAIVFDQVGFIYPGKTRAIFKDLSVSIRAGERVALVGHSGSGKTSFVRLLQCLYALQEGRIAIDGQDITHGSRESLRSAIALVPQDPILFHRSLRDNIAYGKPTASLEAIKLAARQAHIADFIDGLPQGYETLVGERGIKLSGGERQRIAIARAMLADRPILILDEATSSLDSASERAIQEALVALTHGRTSIMIAHRLSTILDADRILVFDEGRIVEEGTHEELIGHENGIYAGFFRLQSGGFIED